MMVNHPLNSSSGSKQSPGSSPGSAKAAAGSSSLQTGWIQQGLAPCAAAAVAVLLAVAAGWQAAQHDTWRPLPLLARTRAEAAPVKLQYPLWWHAPVYAGTGYGTEAVSYITALLQSKRFRREDVWVSHSGDVIMQHIEDSLDEATRQLLQAQEYTNLSRGRLNRSELDRPAIAVCHSFPDCWRMQRDVPAMGVPGCPCPPENDKVAYRIGRTMFETDSLPQHLVQHCNAMDEVWVPSEFNRETFISAGVAPEKLRVVPQGIDAADFDPHKHQPLSLRDLPGAQLVSGTEAAGATPAGRRPYVFLSVFKWEARKGWDILLDAYTTEFRNATDPVELHIFTQPFGKSDEDIATQVQSWLTSRLGIQRSSIPDLPRVYLHTAYVDAVTYRRLYASADCVVLPTRGEGWGRPAMEAMAMARPVITTNWSGPTAYINAEVGYPLEVEALTAASGDMHSTSLDAQSWNEYFAGQRWAQPSVNHLRQLMRQVFTHPEEAAAKGRAAREHVLAHFTPGVLASVIMRELLRIQEKLGPGLKLKAPSPQEHAAYQWQQAAPLCSTHPHLCRQGTPAFASAVKRSSPSLPPYSARHGSARAVIPGQLPVQDLLAMAREGNAITGISSMAGSH